MAVRRCGDLSLSLRIADTYDSGLQITCCDNQISGMHFVLFVYRCSDETLLQLLPLTTSVSLNSN